MLSVIVFSVTLFCLCYKYDNKYTQEMPQAIDGILLLGDGLLEDYPAIFLINGWEIYRDTLLTPADFADKNDSLAKEYVYIGQYGGFEGGDYTRSPHGSATYRLNIAIPPAPTTYTLELPEIFSAYRLYINGQLSEQFGNPNPGAYWPEIGNAAISFAASDNIEIIIAVSDYSHTYSGMVYPPAFGKSAAVSSLLSLRLTLRAAVCAVALLLALFFLISGAFMGKDRAKLLFGLLCLCFIGYTCYPVVRTIMRGGTGWYGFENICFALMLLLTMLLQRTITGEKSKFGKAFVIIGLVACAAYAIRFFLPLNSLRVLAVYSLLTGAYKWMAALFLTVSMVRSAGKSIRYGFTMLTGVLVFDCALVMDRLLPLYEPILFGWFSEIAGFFIVLTLCIVMGQETVQQYRDKLALEGKIAGIESIVAMQQSYYPVILEGVEEARRARHDLRHHLGVIGGLVSEGKHQELERYINEYASSVDNLSHENYCENYVVDVILRHFAALCVRQGIEFTVDAGIPEKLQVVDADICSLISNILENALEACVYVVGEKRIAITLKEVNSQLVLLVDNSFDGKAHMRGGRFLSRKRRSLEGVGLASVQAVAAKYGGSSVFIPDAKKGVFTCEVVLPLIINSDK